MSTKPRAPRYRVRPNGGAVPAPGTGAAMPPQAGTPGSGLGDSLGPVPDDGFGDRIFPTAAAADAATASPADPETAPGAGAREDAATSAAPPPDATEAALAAIRAEGLTGRQLRMARRVAERHGIDAASDEDAVRLLRQRGIDPFRHGNLLELVVGAAGRADESGPRRPGATLPQALPPGGPALPSPHVEADNRMAREIRRVQVEIARRRRRRLAMLFLRLLAFVFLPTALSGYYFSEIAAPMYATKSEFVIQQAQPQGAGGLGSLFSGTAMATQQDSITVQSYLQSREAMLRLDADHGFRAHFSDPTIDPLQRLEPGAPNEDAYKVYRRNVKISYDPTEGLIRMEVTAADPGVSAQFSHALIGYAEEQVDHLTQRLREDQMSGAREIYTSSEENVYAAQRRVIELQEQRGILSAEAEAGLLMSQVSAFETELRQERLTLQEILDNPRPNRTRVEVAERNIARLEGTIADLRAEMTESTESTESLARITSELAIAEGELQTRQLLRAQALEQMEAARVEANRQVRYLSTGVNPVPPDRATYPRVFENTAVAFLIFAGIYLMLSITVSILREQVSA